MKSCPSRGTWIEMPSVKNSLTSSSRSCPSRGTWIEISGGRSTRSAASVVPLAGHVD